MRRNRPALGLSPAPIPSLFVLVGIALGPQGLRVLSSDTLAYLDPAASVALAALGILIGLGLDIRRPHEVRLLGVAALEAGVTILVVAFGFVLVAGTQTTGGAIWFLALIAGICASVSSTVPDPESTASPSIASRIGDLDDVLPIALGGVALALVREHALGAATWLTVEAIVIALAVALAGWLLIARSTSDGEQRVFTAGTVLLLGGLADFLSLSALLTGLVAGVFWNALGDSARDHIARDVRHMQHPLVVLLLLIAGARLGVSGGAGVLVIAYVILRSTAKIAGGWLVGKILGSQVPPLFGLHLISPGVTAVAFALNTAQAAGDRAGPVLAVVVGGSIASELAALFLRPMEPPT